MHLGVLIGLIGQLIAVPATLFLFPNARILNQPFTSPETRAESGESTTLGGLHNDEMLLTPVKQQGDASQDSGEVDGRSSGLRTDITGLLGLNALVKGMEDAVDGFREAFNKLVEPLLHEIPRKAEGLLSSVTSRVAEGLTPTDSSDRTSRYFAELQLAQENAERTLETPGWDEVTKRNGITVWKKYFPKDEYGYQYPCVKARGIIGGSAEEVMGMIVDSTRVLEYNRYSKGRVDVEHLGPRTKIVWNKAQPPLTSKLHDFCTLMHVEPLADGSFMLITRATEHPQAPLLDGHVRSEILLGVTILRPVDDGGASRTEMTTVNHIVSKGIPVMIADRVSTKNAIDFIQNVESAVNAASTYSSECIEGQEDAPAPVEVSLPIRQVAFAA